MPHSNCDLPSISILVTCYNCGPFIKDTLDSVYNQDYKGPLECIIVDDASTDDSPAQIENFIKEHSKKLPITFIRKEQNSGVAETMDIAMSVAKHEWFIMADGDDIQLPNRCSRSIELLRRYPKALSMSMGARHIDQNGNLLNSYQPPFYVPYHLSPDVLYLESHEQRVANWLGTPPKIVGFQTIMHRSVYDTWGTLVTNEERRIRFTQDVTWFMRAMLLGPVLATRELAIHYRQHSSNYENRAEEKGLNGLISRERGKDKLNRFRAGAFISKIHSLDRALSTPGFSDWDQAEIQVVRKECEEQLQFYNLFTDWWSSSIVERIRRTFHYRNKVSEIHHRMCFPRLLPLHVFCWLKYTFKQKK